MSKICFRFFVSGSVQGVFYRNNTCKKAKELNITGWVKNLNDGRVEVFACGEANNIEALEGWLWQGPTKAHVTDVKKEEAPTETYDDFEICQ